jgi:isopentenyl phosphate kinase
MTEVIFVKLGGSIITDKSGEKDADLEKIDQLAEELKEAQLQTDALFIIGHGAGSFGHPQAKKYQTTEGNIADESALGHALVRQAVTELNGIVIKSFTEHGIAAVTLSPNAFITADNKRIKSVNTTPLNLMLDHKLVPVIHGDVLMDETQGWSISSGETILNALAERMPSRYHPSKIIEVGKTDGVYDANNVTVPLITNSNFAEIEKQIGESHGADVTGGMAHKVKEALELASKGIPSLLISAQKGNLKKALLGKEVLCTRIE